MTKQTNLLTDKLINVENKTIPTADNFLTIDTNVQQVPLNIDDTDDNLLLQILNKSQRMTNNINASNENQNQIVPVTTNNDTVIQNVMTKNLASNPQNTSGFLPKMFFPNNNVTIN